MEEKQRTRSVIFLIVIGCLLFLRFGVQMYEARRINEIHERASERASEFAREASERASERARKNERNIEKLRQEFREKWGEEPTF